MLMCSQRFNEVIIDVDLMLLCCHKVYYLIKTSFKIDLNIKYMSF